MRFPASPTRWRALAALLLALLWVSAWLASGRPTFLGRAPGETLQPVQPIYSAAAGVNLERAELEPSRLDGILSDLQRAGIRWVRFTVPWAEVEPARGEYDWAPWDAIFAALDAYPALQPVIVLDGSPPWARAAMDRDNPQAPPHERRDFGAFAAAVAERYGGRVRYYQVWHEPNIAPHWGSRPADPADYLGLLREAAIQIRAADPDAQIVLAALAPTTEAGGANLSDIAYLDALYASGGRAWFDIVAAQPYGFSAPPDAPADPAALNFGRAGLLRRVMLRHGDGATPLWATAFGWNALPDAAPGAASPWGQVNADQQADYARQAYRTAAREQPWLGPLFWAAYCPPRPASDPWLGFALCTADGGRRPAWRALASAARPEPILAPGLYGPDHPALRYSPGWRVTAEAADPNADGDLLDFSFYGTGVDLRVQGGPYWAYYRVTVDGRPANALPRDEAGAAYLVLYDPLAADRAIPLARDLPLAEHAVRVVATGGWGQWALRGVGVTGAAPRAVWPGRLLTALAILATAAWLAWGWAGRGRAREAAVDSDPRPQRLFAWAAAWPDAVWWAAAATFALLLLFSHRAVLDLAALAGLGLIFMFRPDLSLPFIAASLPFWQRPKPFLGWEFGHFELFLWVAVAALVARRTLTWLADRGPRPTDGRHPRSSLPPACRALDCPILALSLTGLVSTLAAAEQGVAWREFRIVFLFGAAFYWLITRAPWPQGRAFSWRPLVTGLLGGMAAASLIGLWQLVTGQGRVDVEGVWRVTALYGSPNNLALLLDRGLPLALALALAASPLLSLPRRGRVGAGVVAWLTVLLLALACVATFSKGALLLGLPAGIAVVLVGAAWRSGRRWPLWALVGLAALGAVGLTVLFRTPRFADLFNFESGTSFLRLKLWQGAWHMAQEHPILGVGPDNFLYAYRTRYVLPSAWEELNLSHPHNILLDLWTRLGLVGVVVGGWALIAAFRAAWRQFRAAAPDVWPLALGLLAGLVATVAHGLIDNSLFLPDLMGLFMIAAGLLWRMDWKLS